LALREPRPELVPSHLSLHGVQHEIAHGSAASPGRGANLPVQSLGDVLDLKVRHGMPIACPWHAHNGPSGASAALARAGRRGTGSRAWRACARREDCSSRRPRVRGLAKLILYRPRGRILTFLYGASATSAAASDLVQRWYNQGLIKAACRDA